MAALGFVAALTLIRTRDSRYVEMAGTERVDPSNMIRSSHPAPAR
jgi:hypothetical protein